jgi:hypothetical protein
MSSQPLGPEKPLKDSLHLVSVKVAMVDDAIATWRSAKNGRNRMDMKRITKYPNL